MNNEVWLLAVMQVLLHDKVCHALYSITPPTIQGMGSDLSERVMSYAISNQHAALCGIANVCGSSIPRPGVLGAFASVP